MFDSYAHCALLTSYHKFGAHYTQYTHVPAAQDLGCQASVLVIVAHRLDKINTGMSPPQIQHSLQSVARWLVGQKVLWFAGQRRRRTDRERGWQNYAIIAQISDMLVNLRGTQPIAGDQPFSVEHGLAFAVLHYRDQRACPLETFLQRWQQAVRHQWSIEVALVLLRASLLASAWIVKRWSGVYPVSLAAEADA